MPLVQIHPMTTQESDLPGDRTVLPISEGGTVPVNKSPGYFPIDLVSAALVAAQGELEAAPFDSQNPFLKNRYASLGAIIGASRPVLAKNGLAILQVPLTPKDGCVAVQTTIIHRSGQFLDGGTMQLPLGDEKGKSLAQVAGSIVTYLKRYAWASVLGMYADEDTDGHHPSQKPPGATPRSTPLKQPTQDDKTPPTPLPATEKTRSWALLKVGAHEPGPRRTCLHDYMVALKWITADKTVESWPLDHVPVNGADLQKLLLRLGEWEESQRAKEP